MNKIYYFIFLIFVFLTGCINNKNPEETIVPKDFSKNISTKELAIKIADLPLLELETVDSYEKFKDVADNINDLIKLLNNEGGYEIPGFEVTEENYRKISRVLTEYGPLIGNYNEVVKAAKDYNDTEEKKKALYISIGKFGLETALIITTAFAMPVYEGVGIAYRAIGLNRFAFSCPTCIEIILGNAHWFVRTYMVEKSSETAEIILNLIETEKLKDLKIEAEYSINKTINWTQEILSSLDKNLSLPILWT